MFFFETSKNGQSVKVEMLDTAGQEESSKGGKGWGTLDAVGRTVCLASLRGGLKA